MTDKTDEDKKIIQRELDKLHRYEAMRAESDELISWLISQRGNWPVIAKKADVTMRSLYNMVTVGVLPRRRTLNALQKVKKAMDQKKEGGE